MLKDLGAIIMDILDFHQTVRHLQLIIRTYTKIIERLNEQTCTVQDVFNMFKILYRKIPLDAETDRDRLKQTLTLSPNSKFKTLSLTVNVSAHTLDWIQDNGDKQIIDSKMFYDLIVPEFRFVVRKYNCVKIANHVVTYRDLKKLKKDL